MSAAPKLSPRQRWPQSAYRTCACQGQPQAAQVTPEEAR
jgi:hypothetical protein